jgi:hypothetical protein
LPEVLAHQRYDNEFEKLYVWTQLEAGAFTRTTNDHDFGRIPQLTDERAQMVW